jgi:predicted permease
LATYVDLRSAGYTPERSLIFRDALIDRLQTVGGIESATWVRSVPFDYRGYPSAPIAVDGYVVRQDEQPAVDYNEVGPGYLAIMGIPLLSGREFTRSDNETAGSVAIVNETMANQYWQGRDPVGSRVQVRGQWRRVVGVASVSKYRRVDEEPKPFLYIPMRQGSGGVNLNIRTSLGPAAMSRVLVSEVRALDPNLAPGEVVTMREQVDRTMAPQRITVLMIAVFGALAVILAAVGLYGVTSYTVSQSTREMALRLALGASGTDLVRLIVWQGARLTGGALVLGGIAALGVTRLLTLYQVSPRNPVSFGLASAVIVLASLMACLIPALKALRISPIRALKD